MQPSDFFRASPFLRWTLIPVLILFGIGMPLMVDEWTLTSGLTIGVLSLGSFLYALALLSPRRFHWAGRAVAGLVFLAYAAYAVHEFFFSDHPVQLGERRSTPSPVNAILGLVVIGAPALWYALRRGRASPSARQAGGPGPADRA